MDAAPLTPAETTLANADSSLALRRLVEAILHFSQAEALGAEPDRCAAGRWSCYMLMGDYERAWQQSDAIRARGSYDPHRVWDGTPLAGRRVMVRSVHGYGDAVQMLRYAPLIRQQGATVILQVSPRLVELARCFPGIHEVIAWGEERPFDVQLEITELPYIFRSTLRTLPAAVPYLTLPAAPGNTRPQVGLVWTGGVWDKSRSIPFHLLQPLLDACHQVDFWSLQAGADNSEWIELCSRRGWGARCAGEHSIAALPAAIAGMDLVISIDSLAAHLAGTLAKPVWLLLRQQADWRWMIDRNDSPWYPSMRLFRQQDEGDWLPVIAEAAHALTTWSADRLHESSATS